MTRRKRTGKKRTWMLWRTLLSFRNQLASLTDLVSVRWLSEGRLVCIFLSCIIFYVFTRNNYIHFTCGKTKLKKIINSKEVILRSIILSYIKCFLNILDVCVRDFTYTSQCVFTIILMTCCNNDLYLTNIIVPQNCSRNC